MTDIALPIDGVPELPHGERLLSDERLAKLASRGSARAFAALYERHHQAIYRYCRSIVRNDHDAQDALQSAMMRAYAALRGRERDLAVRPWLFRIAHNESISILRRRGPAHEPSEDLAQIDGEVERTLETRERLATLLADLHALPERQRAALVMRELSGLSIEEIAGALSISQGAAKQALFEARSSLHELAEGRAMQCETAMAAISQRDGRVLRGRRIRAHLRACESCRAFRAAIGEREADLRALAPPLPAGAAGAVLAHLLAHGGGGHAAGAAAAGSGASLGGHAAASIVAKGVAGVAVLAAATAGTVHLATGTRHHRHPAVGHASSARGAGATSESFAKPAAGAAGSSLVVPGLHNPPTPGSSQSAASNTGAGQGTGNAASTANGSRPPTSETGRAGTAKGSPHDHAAGSGGSGGAGHDGKGAPQGTRRRTSGHAHGAKPHQPASRPPHGARHERKHGTSPTKPATPPVKAPAHGNAGQPQSGQEAAGSRTPAARTSEERVTTPLPAR